jgi:hypothetical protein
MVTLISNEIKLYFQKLLELVAHIMTINGFQPENQKFKLFIFQFH